MLHMMRVSPLSIFRAIQTRMLSFSEYMIKLPGYLSRNMTRMKMSIIFCPFGRPPPPLEEHSKKRKRQVGQKPPPIFREAPAPDLTTLTYEPKLPVREATAPTDIPPREAFAPGQTRHATELANVPSREAFAPGQPLPLTHTDPIREALAPANSPLTHTIPPVANVVQAPTTHILKCRTSAHEGASPLPGVGPYEGAPSQPYLPPQYDICQCDHITHHYKRLRGLQGNIYVLTAASAHHVRPPPTIKPIFALYSPVFTTFHDLPYIPTTSTIHTYLALNKKEDTLTQSQMFQAPDYHEFLKVQAMEICGLEAMEVFHYHPMTDLPPKARLLSSIWSYRRKRRPNGELLKYKARLCVDGSQQHHGQEYWDTYAPVVSWPATRLTLLLSTILCLKSRQVDYTQAFPKADLEDPVFMQLPQGWYIVADGTLQPHSDPKYNDTTHYIKLNKNLYGCK